MNICNKSYQSFLILCFLIASNIHAMEIETHNKSNPKKTIEPIKTFVYFDAKRPALHATKEVIEHLNKKGIATSVQPIVRVVSQAIVYENNRPVNWCLNLPDAIMDYYSAKFNHKLTYQYLRETKKVYREMYDQLFPAVLPVELAFNCANESRINLTIGKFPAEIIFKSKKDFYTEHTEALSDYFCRQTQENGCPNNEKTFIQSLINVKIPIDKSTFKSLQYRELTGSFK